MRLAVAAALGLVLVLGRGARADVRVSGRIEAGAEFDSNAGRIEEVQNVTRAPIVGSPVGRLVASGDLSAAPGERQTLSLSAGLAVKRFMDEAVRGEDVLVGQASGSWTLLLAGRTALGLAASYYDVYQRDAEDPRDFRSFAPTLRLEQGLGAAGVLTVGGGYRLFSYKPYPDFDFDAPTAFATYRHFFAAPPDGGADWELSGGASIEARRFAGAICLDIDTCPGPTGTPARRDQFWVLHLEATRTGAFLAGAGLALHGNASNSYGEPLLRGVLHARGVFLLPAELSLSIRAELVATRYYDQLPLARDMTGVPFVSMDDESRSTLRLELARPLGRRLDAGFRYTYYTNEITGGPVRFRRHTGLLFLALLWE